MIALEVGYQTTQDKMQYILVSLGSSVSPAERHSTTFPRPTGNTPALLPCEREYRFFPGRLWRFDFAWPESKVAVKIEGGVRRAGATRGWPDF